jgi:hypothetical protein
MTHISELKSAAASPFLPENAAPAVDRVHCIPGKAVGAKVGDVVGVSDVIGKYVIVTVAVYTAVAIDVWVTEGVMTPAHIMELKAPVLSYAVLQNTVPAPTATTAILKLPLPPGNTSPRLSHATIEPMTVEPDELHKYCI